VKQNKTISSLDRHTGKLTCFAFYGNHFVSAGKDGLICFWDCYSEHEFRIVRELQLPGKKSSTFLQFNPPSSRFLVIQKQRLALYATTSLNKLCGLESSSRIVTACFSCAGNYVYCAFSCGKIYILSSENFALIVSLNSKDIPCITPDSYVTSLDAHPENDAHFVVGTNRGGVYFLTTSDGNATCSYR